MISGILIYFSSLFFCFLKEGVFFSYFFKKVCFFSYFISNLKQFPSSFFFFLRRKYLCV